MPEILDGVRFTEILALIAAVGAFGTAAFGVTEAFLKGLVWPRKSGGIGLPYAGFGRVRSAIKPLAPALRFAYGDDYLQIIAEQYRNGRKEGRAPNTVLQGVRLALPYMGAEAASELMAKFWGAPGRDRDQLATALNDRSGEMTLESRATDEAAALTGRFALALDSRVDAAFAIAEQRYRASLQGAAGFMAIALSVGFYLLAASAPEQTFQWPHLGFAVLVGVVAVPLAPVAKDLTSALSEAFRAWNAVSRASR